MEKQQLIVVGNGMVGHRFVESFVKEGGLDFFDIHVFGQEPRAAYDRVNLTHYVNDVTVDQLTLVKKGFYEQTGISLRLNTQVTQIDRALQIVTLENGETIKYDRLILATGSTAFVPPIKGHDNSNSFVYRTIEDIDAITACARNKKRAVVLGGGLLGLEAANAIKIMGLQVDVVECATHLMAVQIDPVAGDVLKTKIESLGVSVHTQKFTSEITENEQGLQLTFTDGTSLDTDMIVYSAGIRAQDSLAHQCGLAVGQRGGININEYCMTDDFNIFAIGECASWKNELFGLVAPGYQMAEIVANYLLGGDRSFKGSTNNTKLKLMGVDVASMGDAFETTEGAQSFTFKDKAQSIYKKIVVKDEKLIGAIFVGDAKEYDGLLVTMLNDMPIPDEPFDLIKPNKAQVIKVNKPKGVAALSDDSLICYCNNVTKGQINAAIENGSENLNEVMANTMAATSCGGCAKQVEQLLVLKNTVNS